MRFLYLISHDDTFVPTPELVYSVVTWTRQRKRERVLVDSQPLQPVDEAVTVRLRRRVVRRTSGPFAPSREKMCAYALIKAKNMDEAVEIAATHPMAAAATIEVRPGWEGLG